MLRVPLLIAAVLLLAAPAARAQVFLGSRHQPGLSVSPMFVQASIDPGARDVPVELMFSLAVPAGASALDFEQDLSLLWPGEVGGALDGGGDPRLTAEVEAVGLSVIAAGRLPLLAQRHYEATPGTEALPGGAPFVTYVRTGGPLGLTAPATYIRIPWSPRLANRAWLVNLRLTAVGLVRPRPVSWFNRVFTGSRQQVSLGFNDVISPAMFAMYFARRDRLIPVTDPARLMLSFAESDRLRIDRVDPAGSRREPSQTVDRTDVVSLFLGPSEGLTPQGLTVEYGYLSAIQAWGPLLVPVVFFVFGHFTSTLFRTSIERARRIITEHLHLGARPEVTRDTGRVIPRDRLAAVVPGQTTHAQVLGLCGDDPEEFETLGAPDRKTLIYRGSRLVPVRKWALGWVTAVGRWEQEKHEVEITVERGVVRGVEARVRRARLAPPGPGA